MTGVDFSPGSAAALKHTRLAVESGATLVVSHAIHRRVVTNLAEALEGDAVALEYEMLADARRQLTEFIGAESASNRVVPEVAVGAPLNEMRDAVGRHSADLLVLGVTGASGHRGGVGTFATKCVRQARTRVLLVHDSHADKFRRIAACIDFSKTSERAFAQAMRLARSNNSEVAAVHVYFGPWHNLRYRSPVPDASPAFQRQYLAEVQPARHERERIKRCPSITSWIAGTTRSLARALLEDRQKSGSSQTRRVTQGHDPEPHGTLITEKTE